MSRLKAGIFDLDDTLYAYAPLHPGALRAARAACQACTGCQAAAFDDAFARARALTKERLGNVAAAHNRALYFQATLELLGHRRITDALALYDAYWAYILDNMRLREGVLPLFRYMRGQGMRVAICSDLTAHTQLRKLQRLALSEEIDLLVTSEEAGREKPDAAMFDLCLAKLGLDAEACFFVGDSYAKDIAGALAAGMTPVYFSEEEAPQGAGVQRVQSFDQLLRWLKEEE